ncbi:hypothetical protein [Paracoccus sp. (in: a-proteobacteria)]|uniref:hypothetical protein n=1 Tax=Paracoccus sp. TaxID=267 RepID=UPI0028B1FF65|nr:hypothetical protein [Paracoccus sp. (in: a-proteobacteria)]
MACKRKADCTPEEWAERLRKQNEKRRARKAAGKRYPSEAPEVLNARARERRQRVKGTERYKFQQSQRVARAKARDPVGFLEKKREWRRQWRVKNPGKMREYNQDYNRRRKAGLVAAKPEPMTGERVWQLTLDALRGKYDEPTRMDIAGEAMVAFLEGDALNIKDAVALGMKRHWRMFSKFTTRSLDAEIAEGLRLIDMIADDAPRAGYAA